MPRYDLRSAQFNGWCHGPRGMVALFAFALMPFLTKGIVLGLGLQGYGLQSIYKAFQLIAPAVWRYHCRRMRGVRMLWPTDEPWPGAGTWVIAASVAIALSGSGIALASWLLPRLQINPSDVRAGLDERFRMG